MTLVLWIHALGSIGIFTSRAFLPSFATALLLRYGPRVPWIADTGLLQYVTDVPTWFTSDACLLILGLLSVTELIAERVPEVKVIFDEVHGYLKGAMAALTFLGVLGAADRSTAQGILGRHGAVDLLSALAVGGGVLLTGGARRTVLEPFDDLDQDDDLGVRGLLRPVEDLWAFVGPIVLILMPLLTITALLLTVGVLVLIERRIQLASRVAPIDCPSCGQTMDHRALECPACHAAAASPMAIGPLGGPVSRPANRARQPFALASLKRCPTCATRLTGASFDQSCSTCGRHLSNDRAFVQAYVGYVDRRAVWVVPLCFGLGLIPVLGIIPAVMLYRLAIVAPFRRYLPYGQAQAMKWGLRLVMVVLAAVQWIPVAGGFSVLAMTLIHYGAYRTVFRKLAAV